MPIFGFPGRTPESQIRSLFRLGPPGGPRGRQNDPQGRQNELQGCQNGPQCSQNVPQSIKLQQNMLPEI